MSEIHPTMADCINGFAPKLTDDDSWRDALVTCIRNGVFVLMTPTRSHFYSRMLGAWSATVFASDTYEPCPDTDMTANDRATCPPPPFVKTERLDKRPVAPAAPILDEIEVPALPADQSDAASNLLRTLEERIIHDPGDKSTGDPACDHIDGGDEIIREHTDAAWADGFRAGWRKALEAAVGGGK